MAHVLIVTPEIESTHRGLDALNWAADYLPLDGNESLGCLCIHAVSGNAGLFQDMPTTDEDETRLTIETRYITQDGEKVYLIRALTNALINHETIDDGSLYGLPVRLVTIKTSDYPSITPSELAQICAVSNDDMLFVFYGDDAEQLNDIHDEFVDMYDVTDDAPIHRI